MVSSVAACCVRSTAHALLCTVNGDDLAVFHFLFLVTLTFDLDIRLRQDFGTMYLTAKFHHPTFDHSEVIVRTNKHIDKLTNKRMPLKTSTSLSNAMLVGNKHGSKHHPAKMWQR